LSDMPTEEDRNLYLDIVRRNSSRIGALITELLDSSRPAEMKMEQHILQSILDESIGEAVDRVTLKGINMQIRYPNEPVAIIADKEKLKIAFSNILVNATEAIDHTDGKISVIVEAGERAHQVIISDNGCGISVENVSRLFEPYFTSKRNGMGLGLASTLNIIQSHKGSIDVRSELRKGTSFIISFPLSHLTVDQYSN